MMNFAFDIASFTYGSRLRFYLWFGNFLLAKTVSYTTVTAVADTIYFWCLSWIMVVGAAVCKAAAVDDLSTMVAMPACDLGHWLVSWYSSCGNLWYGS